MGKKLVFVAATLLAAQAFAQGTTTATATTSNSTATETATASQGTSTTTVESTKAEAKKWSASLLTQSGLGIQDEKNFGSKAPIQTASLLTMGFKISDTMKLNAGHNFLIINNFASLDAGTQDKFAQRGYAEGYNVMDPHLGVTLSKVSDGVLGSEPIALALRYYVPVTKFSREMERAGTLRADASIDWTINPKVMMSYVLSPRITLERTMEAGQIYRMIHQVGPSYSFNDNVGAYGLVGFDSTFGKNWNNMKSLGESMELEVGANFQVGSFLINPSVSESIATNETMKVGVAEQSSYNLVLQAAF